MKLNSLQIGELTAEIPVIQGGMGVGISLSSLAGAVAREGGVGIISTAQIGFREADYDKNPLQANLRAIQTEVARARELAKGGIIGVNIMVATKGDEEYVKAAVEASVDLIISGAGLPVTLPALVGKQGTKLAPIVSSVKSFDVIAKYWMKKYNRVPDMVVIEGPKAGGHLGFSMEQLGQWGMTDDSLCAEEGIGPDYDEEIAQIIEKVNAYGEKYERNIPVIVAGGIYNRNDIEHYMMMGASGVQMGTRFVTTEECDASEAYKQTYINSQKEDIIIVKSPVGMPCRAIKNTFINRAKQGQISHSACHGCVSTCKPMETPYCITEALVNAAKGNVDEALLFCGTNAYRAERIETVKEIMDEFR